ncbi:hypothetical protein HAX54_040176, partial [Datura stramonium]|nr:hypothetical protein [Datura stramonium]
MISAEVSLEDQATHSATTPAIDVATAQIDLINTDSKYGSDEHGSYEEDHSVNNDVQVVEYIEIISQQVSQYQCMIHKEYNCRLTYQCGLTNHNDNVVPFSGVSKDTEEEEEEEAVVSHHIVTRKKSKKLSITHISLTAECPRMEPK